MLWLEDGNVTEKNVHPANWKLTDVIREVTDSNNHEAYDLVKLFFFVNLIRNVRNTKQNFY